jgi:hypothetical protein
MEAVFAQSTQRLAALVGAAGRGSADVERRQFLSWMTDVIQDHNVAGLADRDRRNLYPVDLDLIVERAGLLGMTQAELRSKLHLLRGSA